MFQPPVHTLIQVTVLQIFVNHLLPLAFRSTSPMSSKSLTDAKLPVVSNKNQQ